MCSGNLWSFGYPAFAAVTMVTRLMISGLSSFKAIAICAAVLGAIDLILRVVGPTKTFVFNAVWDVQSQQQQQASEAHHARAVAAKRVSAAVVSRGRSETVDPNFKQSDESIAIGEDPEMERARLKKQRREAEARAAQEVAAFEDMRGPRDRSQTAMSDQLRREAAAKAEADPEEEERAAAAAAKLERLKAEHAAAEDQHARMTAYTPEERLALAHAAQNKIMIDRILSEMLAHVIAICVRITSFCSVVSCPIS